MIKSIPQTLLPLICFLFIQSIIYSQDFDVACRNSQPFCSDASLELTFPNRVGDFDGLGEVGCLNTTPNPAWYFLRIDESGELIFDIQQWVDADGDNTLDSGETQLDVDFIAWGPFPTSFIVCDILARGCDNDGDGDNLRPAECENNIDNPDYYIEDLDNTNIIDCSYARESIETLTIPNGQTGEYYIILITNFADQAGVIQLQQTNLEEENAGTTDCTVLEPGVGPDIATCGEFPITIEGRFPGSPPDIPNAVSFRWARADLGTTNYVDIPDPEGAVPFLEVNSEGIYRLSGFDVNGIEVPDSPDELVVLDVSDAVVSVGYSIAEESFAGSYTITAEVVATPEAEAAGFDDFEYRLDIDLGNGFIAYRPFQSSPVFSDVPPGDYRITARYANCPASEVDSDIIMILGYPKYFTPNGDGFHDTWSLINIEDQPTALIYIFDRYGKLLKQIRPGGPGWDGTYNGSLMPSNDYWFRVEFNEPRDPNMRRRVFAGNFSLIR
ncbi:T9SS type B sorting domain-containing protein [Aquimarina sp. 2201CG5-10]|uniref:T9SS type B sorting domain-containing protein n=1 Tax=Aquimarina callyspongiae TaxID=3098150 RepID=UPI002AB3C99A|nr:T9SS type B sorting domain-containing protein [Aquimarina sp. 2201CG5-10]MDY8134262.1 T9SS type B sorting domain-containing protein [Aquimarina sp. 2201CG5-10]